MMPGIESQFGYGHLCAQIFVFVRHLILFLLILQLVGGNAIGGELMKMPFLIRHFALHRVARPVDSLVDFLRLHYANGKHRDTDSTHRQLPFHSCPHPVASAMVMPVDTGIGSACPEARRIAGLSARDENLLPCDFRSGVLRPPRT